MLRDLTLADWFALLWVLGFGAFLLFWLDADALDAMVIGGMGR